MNTRSFAVTVAPERQPFLDDFRRQRLTLNSEFGPLMGHSRSPFTVSAREIQTLQISTEQRPRGD
jgi:hypothetical protein